MLKVLRDNLKYLSWILWVVILIFIAFVFVDFGGGLSRGSGTRASAATVGNDKISYADFERQYRQLEAQYRQAFGENFTPEIAKQLRLPLQALDRLVDQRLLLNEASERGLEVGDEVRLLETRLASLRKDLYKGLTPMQRVLVARHPKRPYTSDR